MIYCIIALFVILVFLIHLAVKQTIEIKKIEERLYRNMELSEDNWKEWKEIFNKYARKVGLCGYFEKYSDLNGDSYCKKYYKGCTVEEIIQNNIGEII